MNEGFPPGPDTPANWRAALSTLVATRLAIFEYEAQTAARGIGRTAAIGGVAVFSLLLFWLLLLAALIGWLPGVTGLPWFVWAAIAASVHLVAAIVSACLLKSARKPTFELTRNEFRKDRAWIDNIHPPKSKH